MVINIAFSGPMASGKSTAAVHAHQIEPDSVVMSFAAPIYEVAKKYWGMEEKDRDLLIFIGESWRKRDPDIWVNIMLREIKKWNDRGISVFIDDLRLPAEFEALSKADVHLVRLNISEQEQERRLRDKYPDTYEEHLKKTKHETETALEDTNLPWSCWFAHDLSLVMTKKSIETIVTGLQKHSGKISPTPTNTQTE